jgi:ABC-type Fe3+/spermidine/putrescine transport system ATPase subunit
LNNVLESLFETSLNILSSFYYNEIGVGQKSKTLEWCIPIIFVTHSNYEAEVLADEIIQIK